jgi:hypothetical protein
MPAYPETRLTRALRNAEFPVIVSLARHDLDLAKAAIDAGAFAIKVHLNAHHRATGTTFGSFAEEQPFFEDLATLGVPLLVMAGQEKVPNAREMDALAALGFEGQHLSQRHAIASSAIEAPAHSGAWRGEHR